VTTPVAVVVAQDVEMAADRRHVIRSDLAGDAEDHGPAVRRDPGDADAGGLDGETEGGGRQLTGPAQEDCAQGRNEEEAPEEARTHTVVSRASLLRESRRNVILPDPRAPVQKAGHRSALRYLTALYNEPRRFQAGSPESLSSGMLRGFFTR